MTDMEKIEKLRELVKKGYDSEFNFSQDHWENGNFDDSYEYGVESGEQYMLGRIKRILDSSQFTQGD